MDNSSFIVDLVEDYTGCRRIWFKYAKKYARPAVNKGDNL